MFNICDVYIFRLTECPVYMKAEDQFVKTKHTYFDVCPTFLAALVVHIGCAVQW